MQTLDASLVLAHAQKLELSIAPESPDGQPSLHRWADSIKPQLQASAIVSKPAPERGDATETRPEPEHQQQQQQQQTPPRLKLPLAAKRQPDSPRKPQTPPQVPPPRARCPNLVASSIREQGAVSQVVAKPMQQPPRDYSDFHFVTFFCTGDFGHCGNMGFQFERLDMSWAGAIARSHPGAKLAIMTDANTEFDFAGYDVEVCRNEWDCRRLGRNSYCNLYQFQGEVAYLKKLQQENIEANVVFVDTDILVLKPLSPAFDAGDFAFGCTISDSKAMPVNIGMQFVKKGHAAEAIRFLENVLDVYRIDPLDEFCAGQIAIAETLGLYDSYDAQLGLCAQANGRDGFAIRDVGSRKQHRVAFLACSRYNYCNMEDSCCTDPYRWMKPLESAQDFIDADVRALHFVGWRKCGLPAVYKAFVTGDLKGAFTEFVANYRACPHLPHYQKLDERRRSNVHR